MSKIMLKATNIKKTYANSANRLEVLKGVDLSVNEGVVLKSELDRQQDLIIMRAAEAEMQLPPAHILREQVLERLIIRELPCTQRDEG